jgi:hypothetical protein
MKKQKEKEIQIRADGECYQAGLLFQNVSRLIAQAD